MANSVGTVPDLDGKITEGITHVQVFSASTSSNGAADGAQLAQSAPDHSYESTKPTTPQIEMSRQQVSNPVAARFAALVKAGPSLGLKPEETQDIANLGNSTNATQASRQDDEKEATDSTKKKQSSEGLARIVKMVATPARTKPSKALCTSKFLQLFASAASAQESYAVLACVHKQMNGQGWERRGGWGSYLVRKSQAELDDGRVYGVKSDNGLVVALLLKSNNMRGRIPPILARLGSLKCMNFADNHISGSIPGELGFLLQLEILQLQENNLRDGISPLLGSLTNLIRLSLGSNKLTGHLPDSLGSLASLQHLSVENNRLAGCIPAMFCRLSSLETLNLSNNRLEGEIPSGIGDMAMLRKLDLQQNLLMGAIPDSVCSLRHLTWLHLNGNQLTGPIPTPLGELTSLLVLNLGHNNLVGPLPPAIGEPGHLVCVSMRGNALEGPFPLPPRYDAERQAGGLRSLDLGKNNLDAPFPDLAGLSDLRSLELDNNQVFGTLEGSISQSCPNLFRLHLQNNRLDGEIPASLGSLSRLEILDLSGNSFQGGIPSELEALKQLRFLSASNNQLGGDLPSFLGSMSSLRRLALDGNKFAGSVPPELGMLNDLRRLYLERNHLEGEIPSSLSKCRLMEELYLHQNALSGKIPESLRSLKNLRYLYLYQALQQVEWLRHALLQLMTELVAILSHWTSVHVRLTLWLALGTKVFVIGVVSMHRLDDKRVSRLGEERASKTSSLASTFHSKLAPRLRYSAWPRLMMIFYHVAELATRAFPLAAVVAGLKEDAIIYTPIVMVPGMLARWGVRWRLPTSTLGSVDRKSLLFNVEVVLSKCLALDSEFGQGTRAHALATVVTTLEFCAFISLAASLPRPYPSVVAERLLSVCTLMLVYTWVVLVVEMAMAIGRAPPLSPDSRLFITTRVISLTKKWANHRRPGTSPSSRTILVRQNDTPSRPPTGKVSAEKNSLPDPGTRGPSTVVPVEGWDEQRDKEEE